MTGLNQQGRLQRLVSAARSTRLLGFLLIASVILPALLFAGFSYLSYRTHMMAAEARLRQTLDVVHEHVSKVFETHELVTLHIHDILGDRSAEQIRRTEEELHHKLAALKAAMPQVRDLRVLDDNGRPLVSASLYPFRSGDASEADFFRIHQQRTVSSYVSDLMQSRQRTGTFFLESRRWNDDRANFRGIIIISVEPVYFHNFFGGFPEGFVFSLIKDNGAVLARYPTAPDGTARLPASSGFMTQIARFPAEGMYRATSGVDGVERIASYRKLSDRPLYVTANFGIEEILSTWRKDIFSHAMLAGPVTFGLFLITLLAFTQALRERRVLDQLRQEIDLRQRTEAQLVQAQKMEAVGRLTGGIAHDFNNLLTVILGNLETVARQAPKANERLSRAIGNAREGADRAASLTHRLLAFSRRQPLEAKPIDLNALVAGMADLMRRTIGESIAVESRLAAGLSPVLADLHQTENALLNLVINARDAMPQGGRLIIETANVDVPPGKAASKQTPASGNYVVLSVTDTGAGIPPETLDMVFEPFFTTKPAGQGTGLGLSMVYGFMRQSGGYVTIESELEHGTIVRLYFPRHAGIADEAPAARRIDIPVEPTGNGELILVCEDDESVRDFSAQTLRDLGYRVVEAEGVDDALTKLDANPSVVVLFTDVVLPKGNGRALADEARRRRPGLKVLFTTGYTRDAIVHDGRLDADVELLQKPFTSADLGRRIRALFDAT